MRMNPRSTCLSYMISNTDIGTRYITIANNHIVTGTKYDRMSDFGPVAMLAVSLAILLESNYSKFIPFSAKMTWILFRCDDGKIVGGATQWQPGRTTCGKSGGPKRIEHRGGSAGSPRFLTAMFGWEERLAMRGVRMI